MIGGVVDTIVHWVEPVFDTAGYWVVAVAVLLERSLFVGLIIPGDIILALGGVYAARGDLRLVWVVVIASAAAVCGESIGYWLGRRYGIRLVARLPFGDRLSDRMSAAETYFAKRGAGWTVAIGRFATAAGAFVPFTAGVGHMGYRRFLLYDVPAIVLWASAITTFGYVFGRNLDFLEKALSRFGYAVLGLLLVFFCARWLVKRRRGRRDRAT